MSSVPFALPNIPELGTNALPNNIFYVDSGNAFASDNSAYGLRANKPFATIDFAVGQCTASNADVIIVAAGHAEAVIAAGGLDLDVAGITIWGMGNGTNKPTVTLSTATTADVDVDAANITVRNIRFVSAINDLAVVIDANAGNLTMIDCDFVSTSANECFNFINLATTVDDFQFTNCSFYQPTDPAGTDAAVDTGAIFLIDSENVFVDNCRFIGNFETACIHNRTTACSNLWVRNCYGEVALSTSLAFTLVAGVTGGMQDCAWQVTPAAAVTITDFFELPQSTPFCLHRTTFGNDCASADDDNLAIAITTSIT